jgi:P27 family predicted phage terminase small subunit
MKSPKHLSPGAAKWWREIVRIYAMESHDIRLLTLAAESWDRACQARLEIEQHGKLTYTDSAGNFRPHPSVQIERDSRAAFAKIVKQLSLSDDEPKRGPGRPTILNEPDY